jgi:hypothetical protein
MHGPRRADVLCVVLLLLSTLAAPAAAQEPSPSAAVPPSPAANLSPEASAMAVEAQAIVAEVFAGVAESPEELAAEARATEIERTGLAEIDPELPALLAELEAEAAEGFAMFVAEAPTFPPPSGEPSADGSPAPSAEASPSPEAGSSAFLAARAPGPRSADLRFAQGGSYLSSIGEVLGFARREVGNFVPSMGSGRNSSEPFVRGGASYRIDEVWAQDSLTIIIERSEEYTVPGASPDAPPYTVTDTGGTTLLVDTCPDEDGTIVVTANASGTYDVVGEDLSYHATLDTNDEAVVTVDPEAEIASRRHTLTVRGTAVGDRPAFAGGEGAVDAHLGATLTWPGEAGSGARPEVSLTTVEGVDVRDLRSAFTGGAFTAALVDAAIDAAATVWKDGRCLELQVDPPGMKVDPGSRTGITVTIKHKAFPEDVEREVEATLEGTEALDPPDDPMSPAYFEYTATSAPQGEGTITFTSVSNRGVARERAETYVVDQRLLLDVDLRTTFRQGPVSTRGTVRANGLRVTPIAADAATGAPPGVTVEGDLDFRGRARSPLCAGSYRDAFPVDPANNASATITGEGEDRRLVVSLRLADRAAKLTARVRCDVGGVDLDIPAGRMLPVGIELPLAGGTATWQSNESGARVKGTFTLRTDPPR